MKIVKNIKFYLNNFKIVFLLILIILFVTSPGLFSELNNSIKSVYFFVKGESTPSPEIALIHIDGKDTERLGWPLKRNYYALLIDFLNRCQVRKIGIEIFLAPNVAFQSIYNDLLIEKINDAGNVVLGSLPVGIREKNKTFTADSIIYPETFQFTNASTGHLNYIEDGSVSIPRAIAQASKIENAFAVELTEQYQSSNESVLNINLNCSWKSFQKFSLLEFFRLAEKNDPKLNDLKNKIVIVGLSDPALARNINSYFDDLLPGIGLHAIAADNILTGKLINRDFYIFSGIVFLLIFFILSPLRKGMIIYPIVLIVLLICGYLFFLANIELFYSAFFIPAIFFFFIDLIIFYKGKQRQFEQALNESAALSRALNYKESQLQALSQNLDLDVESAPGKIEREISKLKDEIESLKIAEADETASVVESANVKNFEGLVFKSKKMDAVVKLIKTVAPEDATVLILGESGSGKELAAKAIHNLSRRRGNKFVAVNCAALTDSLLESELFGHVKGAFTGAVTDTPGLFKRADKGTIFLDEIGETSDSFQAKLLRVLQSGEIQPVGSNNVEIVDARVIAATNRNLEGLVRGKKFREDLYYRLNVIPITMPPLRNRKEDIEVLADHFVKNESENFSLSEAVKKQLIENTWKGNVRELESVLKRAVIFTRSANREIVKLNDLPPEIVNLKKSELEDLILVSLREKNFSHSSINETAEELGNLNRTVVTEHFRGLFFKLYYLNSFDLEKTAEVIAGGHGSSSIDKVKSKCGTFLKNIEKSIGKLQNNEFVFTKEKLASKYKNLPRKYHLYLDELIKYILSQ